MRHILKTSVALLALALATPSIAQEKVLGLAAIDLQNSFFVRMKEAGDVATTAKADAGTRAEGDGSAAE